jgi:hypothetical protein
MMPVDMIYYVAAKLDVPLHGPEDRTGCGKFATLGIYSDYAGHALRRCSSIPFRVSVQVRLGPVRRTLPSGPTTLTWKPFEPSASTI